MILLQEDTWISEWQTGAGPNGDESGDGDGSGDVYNYECRNHGDGDAGLGDGSGESYWSITTFEHLVTNAAVTITYKRI